MAGFRKPGPQCSYNDRLDIDDGTMCRSQTHIPGPLGIPPNLLTVNQRGDGDTYIRALQLAPAALYRETGYTFDGETLQGLIAGLIRARTGLVSADSFPAAHIGKKDIVTSLGLNFLSEAMSSKLGEMLCVLPMGILRMDERREHDRELEQAAEALAFAAGVFVRFILQGIVSYILNRASISQEAVPSGRAIRLPESKITPDAAVAQIAGQLRTGKLGNSFATWIEKNWQHLLKNPQLRGVPRRSGGAAAERIVSERRSRGPTAPTQPAAEPATFPDIDFAAQASKLVAAAVHGAPFCPV